MCSTELIWHRMILYGAGGHAEVVYDCIRSRGIDVKVVFDDDPTVNSFHGLAVVSKYDDKLQSHEKMILAIGSNRARFTLSNRVNHSFGQATHRTAYLADSCIVEEGAMILAKAIIQVKSRIGKHTIINSGAIIEHNSMVSDFVHVGPGAVICGDVYIGTGALIGANATILPGMSIGEWSIVGAGTVVRENVNKKSRVVGNPARKITG